MKAEAAAESRNDIPLRFAEELYHGIRAIVEGDTSEPVSTAEQSVNQ